MNPLDNNKAANLLQWWLDVATKGLAATSKERIAKEIELHYTEAVEAHLDEGLSDIEARTAALEELGEPSVARKFFRRNHLTQAEEKRLLELVKSFGSLGRMSPAIFLVVCAAFLFLPNEVRSVPLAQAAVRVSALIVIALHLVSFLIVKHPGSRPIIASLLFIYILSNLAFLVGSVVFFGCILGKFDFIIFFTVAYPLFEAACSLRSWRKICRTIDLGNGTPKAA